MAKVLIVYENIPESTELFIVDAFFKDLDDLRLCANNYLNLDVPDNVQLAMERVGWYLANKDYFFVDGQFKPAYADDMDEAGITPESIGKWGGCKVDTGQLIDVIEQGISHVVVTGAVM